MTPGTYNLNLYRGDSYSWRFQLWHDDAKTQPVDLTGSTAAAEIRDRSAGTNIVALDAVITDAPAGIIDVAFPATLWADNPPAGKWDLELTDSAGNVNTIVAGAVKITGDITNSSPAP